MNDKLLGVFYNGEFQYGANEIPYTYRKKKKRKTRLLTRVLDELKQNAQYPTNAVGFFFTRLESIVILLTYVAL